MRGNNRKTLSLCLLVLLLLTNYASAEPSIGLELKQSGENTIQVPVISGLDDVGVQDGVNGAIQMHLSALEQSLKVIEATGSGRLQVVVEAVILPKKSGNGLLSMMFSAMGRLPSGRTGHQLSALMLDLDTSLEIKAEDLFKSFEDARLKLEEMTLMAYAEDLSNYLDISGISPFPSDQVYVSETGLTFAYPENGMVWLSGNTASIHFLFHEVLDLLNLEEGSTLNGLDLPDLQAEQAIDQAAIHLDAGLGQMPGFDVKLGDALLPVIDRYKLLFDPEGFPTGQKFQLEEDRFRGTWLISHSGQTVEGILSSRRNYHGLICGKTSLGQAVEALGEAAIQLPLDESAASLYGLPPGQLHIYPLQEVELRLHFDQMEILAAIWLSK